MQLQAQKLMSSTISRFYFNHRYSDDLDLFANEESSFSEIVEKAFNMYMLL